MNALAIPATYRAILSGLWIAWVAYWAVTALRAKQVARRESAASRASHVIPLMIVAWLLVKPPLHWPLFPEQLLPATLARYQVGVALVVVGLLFSVWARIHLAGNWSASVTVKERHELVRSGPYRLVRHPIYTGLLAGLLGTAVVRGDIQGLVAVAIALIALWHKLHVEERFMEETFGGAYRDYRAQVKALIPFVL
jgi:protein-S-isoprenylcysteine O-methyltransferase Ste14